MNGIVVPVEGRELVLDPSLLGTGPRTLTVTIAWSDGTLPRTLRRSFEVEADATWAEDIEPIYLTYCSDCHGAAGPSARGRPHSPT